MANTQKTRFFTNTLKWNREELFLVRSKIEGWGFRQLSRNRYLLGFILVGGFSLLIEAAVVAVLPESISFTYRLVTGFMAGVAFAFVGNTFFNFRVSRDKLLYTLLMFVFLSLVSLLVNSILRANLLANSGIPYPQDRVIVSGFIFLFAFYLHRRFTFKGSWRNLCYGISINALAEDSDALGKSTISSRLAIGDLCECIHVNASDTTFFPGSENVNPLGLSALFEQRRESRVHLHLMSRRPLALLDSLPAVRKVEAVVFHPICDDDPFQVIARCLELGVKVGIAWNRGIRLAEFIPFIPHADFVLCLIGGSGGETASISGEEIKTARALYTLTRRHGSRFIIEGDLRPENVAVFQADYYVPPPTMLLNQEPLLAALRLGRKSVNVINHRAELLHSLWQAVDSLDWILSATLVGGFARTDDLSAASDIDFVVVVDYLTKDRYDELMEKISLAARLPLKEAGYEFRLNCSKGPLKFNDDNTAVLHLMCYSVEDHRQHVQESPFTCFDWQRSPLWRKAPLSEIYPAFQLQPRNFFSGRRGCSDYLSDLSKGTITYRTIVFSAAGAAYEEKRYKEMTPRDKNEFAYHIMRFIMQNILKLTRKSNVAPDGHALLSEYFSVFSDGAEQFSRLYMEIWRIKEKKSSKDCGGRLLEDIGLFLQSFETQFRRDFYKNGTRLVFIRHAPTLANAGKGQDTVFQGVSDISIDLNQWPGKKAEEIRRLLEEFGDTVKLYTSPLSRAVETLSHLVADRPIMMDDRLKEIDYGACEMRTVSEARIKYPELFSAFFRGEDPQFPGEGESQEDVLKRALEFIEGNASEANVFCCSHNVVIRCLVGHYAGVPKKDWFKIVIPHLCPIRFIFSQRFGIYPDWDTETEKVLFANMGTVARQ